MKRAGFLGLIVLAAGLAGVAEAVAQMDPAKVLAGEPGRPRTDSPPVPGGIAPGTTGNPLWTIPIKSLRMTRERPIFSPSRRPPPRAVASAAVSVPAVAVAATTVAEQPNLQLVGAVSGETDGVAVFMDDKRNFVRLRTGEAFGGWLLSGISGREVTLEKDSRKFTLGLPSPTGGVQK